MAPPESLSGKIEFIKHGMLQDSSTQGLATCLSKSTMHDYVKSMVR